MRKDCNVARFALTFLNKFPLDKALKPANSLEMHSWLDLFGLLVTFLRFRPFRFH